MLTRDSAILEIALAAGVTRLAAGARGLPAAREFSATLLILRELLHHLDFASVLIAT